MTFLERQMNKMSDLYDETLLNLTPLPEPDEFGQVKLSYQNLRKLLEERRKITYANGFFFGVSCTMGKSEHIGPHGPKCKCGTKKKNS